MSARNRKAIVRASAGVFIEQLESRQMMSASHHVAQLSLFVNRVRGHHESATSLVAAYTPTQMRHAYGFDQISFGSITGNGSGETIAIVDAYDDPNLVSSNSPSFLTSDLHIFDKQYNLPDPQFIKLNQTGGTSSYPTTDATGGWELEEALDVEWAHAIAPAAKIVLVEANSNYNTDLLPAVATASSYPGVVAVSMSFGFNEYPSETSDDSYFAAPAGHVPITYVAASGDTGDPGLWPAYSPDVVAVGGTTLSLNGSNNISSETAWTYSGGKGGGGGVSQYESLPSYQTGLVEPSTTGRNTPDISYDAAPTTGVSTYDSFNYNGGGPLGWAQVGGTSAGAPQIAAMIAIADQGRQLNGNTSLNGATQVLPEIYSLGAHSSADFHDITSGSNQVYSATAGYDAVTGWGSPAANSFVSDLLNV
jgi:subtilase family serine protease